MKTVKKHLNFSSILSTWESAIDYNIKVSNFVNNNTTNSYEFEVNVTF